jgi:hypothetical protein
MNRHLYPDLDMADIREAVVSDKTRDSYHAEIFNFLQWLKNIRDDVLSQQGLELLVSFDAESPGLPVNKLYTKHKARFVEALAEVEEFCTPLIDEDRLTAELYIDYTRGYGIIGMAHISVVRRME